MEQAKLTRQRRRSHQEVMDLLKEFDTAGISASEFCLARDVKLATFCQWRTRHREKSSPSVPAFAPLQIVPSIATGLFAEVGNIRIYQPVAPSFLKELVG